MKKIIKKIWLFQFFGSITDSVGNQILAYHIRNKSY
jgi:hypothetical protein